MQRSQGPKATSLVLISADEDTDRLIPELVTTSTNFLELDTATVNKFELPATQFIYSARNS